MRSIGKVALRRQAVAGLERAARDLGGDGVGQLGIFEFRHYCTESNVLLAPIQLPDHLGFIKPAIALRRARAIRGRQGAAAAISVAPTASLLPCGSHWRRKMTTISQSPRNPRSPNLVGRIDPLDRCRRLRAGRLLGAPGRDQDAARTGRSELRDIGLVRSQIEGPCSAEPQIRTWRDSDRSRRRRHAGASRPHAIP